MTPVVINNRDRFSTTKNLVEQLQRIGYSDIHIIDNGSAYEPLLDWYKQAPGIRVYMTNNIGPRAIYDTGYISNFEGWMAYTDSDIELHPATTTGFIEEMISLTEKYNYTKGGLALRIDDIGSHQFGYKWKDWERRYWENKLEDGIYEAELDTTFCLVRKEIPFDYKALRFSKYQARHIPWYLNADFTGLSEEETFYIKRSSSESTYKKCYNQLHD